MWVLKGSLLGIGIFISGVALSIFGRFSYAMYLTSRVVKAGGDPGAVSDISLLPADPIVVIAFIAAIALGLWTTRSPDLTFLRVFILGTVFAVLMLVLYMALGIVRSSGQPGHATGLSAIKAGLYNPIFWLIVIAYGTVTYGTAYWLLRKR